MVNAQVIIANRNVKISDISKSEVRDIFLGASSSFKDGMRAVPVTLKGGVIHETFLKAFIGKNDAGFRGTWRAVIFSGQGIMPKVFESESALIEHVATVPGAIGYVEGTANLEKVKTLTVK